MIKVDLDFKITNKMHTLYGSYFSFPPKGIIYNQANFRGINNKTYKIFRALYYLLRKIGIITEKEVARITDNLRKDSESDIIHFANYIGKTIKPCVSDYENVGAFVGLEYFNKDKKVEQEKLLKQDSLKFLLPMNREALRSFKLYFKDSVKTQQEILYPVTFIPEKFRPPVKKENLVVFGGSSNIRNEGIFYTKGSYETLISFEKLAKMFPSWKFMYIGDIPADVEVPKAENIIIKKIVPLEKLYEILNRAKLFVQPCYSTPATIFLIAMWFKMPIVTYDYWANKEYVDVKNGILIKPEKASVLNEFNVPVINPKAIEEIIGNAEKNSEKITNAISNLIKKEKLIEKMGENGFNRVNTGKFSIEKRNRKLYKIYKETLK